MCVSVQCRKLEMSEINQCQGTGIPNKTQNLHFVYVSFSLYFISFPISIPMLNQPYVPSKSKHKIDKIICNFPSISGRVVR